MLLNRVYFCGAIPNTATESVATHSLRLQPSIICKSQLQPWCSAALVPKFTTLKSGIKAQVTLETTIEPHDLVYYLGLEPVLHGRKAKVLPMQFPLDHRCLFIVYWHLILRVSEMYIIIILNLHHYINSSSYTSPQYPTPVPSSNISLCDVNCHAFINLTQVSNIMWFSVVIDNRVKIDGGWGLNPQLNLPTTLS